MGTIRERRIAVVRVVVVEVAGRVHVPGIVRVTSIRRAQTDIRGTHITYALMLSLRLPVALNI